MLKPRLNVRRHLPCPGLGAQVLPLGGIGTRLAAWRQRHPRWAIGGLVVLVALLGGAGYRGGWYLWARSHFRAAQQALDRHAWAEARKHLQACQRVWSDSPAVHLAAARAARRLEKFDEAKEHLDSCQRLPGTPEQALKVERSLLQVWRSNGDLTGQEEFLRDCVRQDDPDAVEILDSLSVALIIQYRILEAHECLGELLRRQPDHFDALARRGVTAKNLGWYAEAVEHLDKALALRPDADNVRLGLAEIQVVLGRFTDAQPHFELLLKHQPGNPSVLFGLARCRAGLGDKEKALPLLDRVLAGNPNDWKALGERGWVAVELDRPAEGETYLRQAIALAPPDVALLVHFADCLRLVGKSEEARENLDKADRLKADIRRADQLGDLIREKDPNNPDLRHELACILLRVGKKPDALHWFGTALEKNPRHRPTHQSLAEFYEQAGDFERAAQHRRFLEGSGGTPP
jgi:tetratricopeptide (TPR) repeat protein